MKKTNSKMNVLKAILGISALCAIAIPASVTPANAYEGALPVSINQIMMESGAGGSMKHDTDMLRYKRNEKEIKEDYNIYENKRNFTGNEGQVIKDYNSDSSFMQGQIEDIDTQGVYINSVEVAPSSILSKDEVNNVVKQLVGKNVFISDIQKAIDEIIICMPKKVS